MLIHTWKSSEWFFEAENDNTSVRKHIRKKNLMNFVNFLYIMTMVEFIVGKKSSPCFQKTPLGEQQA